MTTGLERPILKTQTSSLKLLITEFTENIVLYQLGQEVIQFKAKNGHYPTKISDLKNSYTVIYN
jgi:hypothetical protein